MSSDAAPVVLLPTRRATIRLAARLAKVVRPSDLLILSGDLGAGKTFFARAFARALGVPHEIAVTSPTFSIAHELAAKVAIVHADLYRLTSAREVTELGLDEQRAGGAVLVVEWGEPYVEELGGDALIVTFETTGERRAVLRSTGPRGQSLLEAASVS